MIEIRYSDYREWGDIAGTSVSRTREIYRTVLDIPDTAKAILNGRLVNRDLEPETILDDDDNLLFADEGKVEIIYGDYHEVADLVGISIDEVRNSYMTQWDIPDTAKTLLNEEPVNREVETVTVLKDSDVLVFAACGWVEVIYNGNHEVADLAGMTVAWARELYETEWEMPSRARVKLNDRDVKRAAESRLKLLDGDKLVFYARRRALIPVLLALLLTLGATGAVFAYVTAITTITPSSAPSDFAMVETYSGAYSFAPSCVLGRHKGSIGAGTVFVIRRDPCYTGYLKIHIYLTNIDRLVRCYQFIGLKLQLRDAPGPHGNVIDQQTIDLAATTGQDYQLLTMETAVVTFELKTNTTPAYVYLTSGSYSSTPWGWLTGCAYVDSDLYAEVVQY